MNVEPVSWQSTAAEGDRSLGMAGHNGNGNGNNGNNGNSAVTYAEVRRMAYWLNAFTARDLADALHVHEAVGERFVKALLWSGHVGGPIIADTGIELEGPERSEALYEVLPMPTAVYPRNKYPPVWLMAVIEMGGFLLYNERGRVQRIRTQRQMRRSMSTPGARQHHKARERAWRRQEDAKRNRSELERRKRIAKSQGRKFDASRAQADIESEREAELAEEKARTDAKARAVQRQKEGAS